MKRWTALELGRYWKYCLNGCLNGCSNGCLNGCLNNCLNGCSKGCSKNCLYFGSGNHDLFDSVSVPDTRG